MQPSQYVLFASRLFFFKRGVGRANLHLQCQRNFFRRSSQWLESDYFLRIVSSTAALFGPKIVAALHEASKSVPKGWGTPEDNYSDVVLIVQAAAACKNSWDQLTKRLKSFNQKSLLESHPDVEFGEIAEEDLNSLIKDLAATCKAKLKRQAVEVE